MPCQHEAATAAARVLYELDRWRVQSTGQGALSGAGHAIEQRVRDHLKMAGCAKRVGMCAAALQC